MAKVPPAKNLVQELLHLADERKYRSLPTKDSEAIRLVYWLNLPQVLASAGPRCFYTPYGSLLATNYERIVIGD